MAELKQDHFYGGLPKQLKAMVAYLKASPQEKTYSDYLQAARETEKEDSMELSQSPWNQAIDNTAKPRTTSFFHLQKLKGNQPVTKMPAMCLVHLEEKSAKKSWGSGQQRPWQYQWGYWEIHGVPCEGCEGHPSGREAVLSLQ